MGGFYYIIEGRERSERHAEQSEAQPEPTGEGTPRRGGGSSRRRAASRDEVRQHTGAARRRPTVGRESLPRRGDSRKKIIFAFD